jgi:predicted GIY-YIG superfamily endonuclease
MPGQISLFEQARRMVPSLSRGIPCTYILRLRSGGLYVGCSIDCEKRFCDHETGIASRTTKADPPDSLLWIEIHPDFPSGRSREAQIKKWSRAKKLALARGDWESLRNLSRSND